FQPFASSPNGKIWSDRFRKVNTLPGQADDPGDRACTAGLQLRYGPGRPMSASSRWFFTARLAGSCASLTAIFWRDLDVLYQKNWAPSPHLVRGGEKTPKKDIKKKKTPPPPPPRMSQSRHPSHDTTREEHDADAIAPPRGARLNRRGERRPGRGPGEDPPR